MSNIHLEQQNEAVFVRGSLLIITPGALMKAPCELQDPRFSVSRDIPSLISISCISACLGRPYKVVFSNICKLVLTKTGILVLVS